MFAGLCVFVYSLFISFLNTDPQWLFLVAITAAAGLFSVRLPFVGRGRESVTITVSDIFIYAGILLYSPEVAVLLSVLDGFLAAVRADKSRKAYRALFNLSQLSLSTWFIGHIFYRLVGADPPLEVGFVGGVSLFLNIGLCALLHFFFNSGAVALALSLVTGKRLREILSENLLWASLSSIAGAAGAAVIFLNFESTPFFAFAVTLPIVLVIYYGYKMNLSRIKMAQDHLEELDELYHSTITSLAMAIDAKDQGTHGNVQRVKVMVLGLARELGVKDDNVLKGLRAAALLHDIGKLAVPEYILNKPGKLTEGEAAKVRSHPAIGADILETVPFPYPVVPFVRYHHERWDGQGYPEGRTGEEIPLGARILALVDCYFGLRSDRPFRPKLSRELALNLIKHEAGTSFDPTIVDTFLANVDRLEQEAEQVEQEQFYPTIRPIDKEVGTDDVAAGRLQGTVFHDIASTYKEMQAVYEVSQSIGRSLSMSDTLSHLSARIKRFVPYASCVIYLINSEDDRVIPHHVAGMYKTILEGVEIQLGEGVTGWVAAHKKPLCNVSPEPDFPNLEALRSVFNSCLAVPLLVGNSVVGVISLYSNTRNVYSEEHIRLMEAIAPHSAAAISNAIVYEETQEDAFTDPLTGLPNIRYFNTYVDEELKRAKRLGYPVSLLMMDLERFKAVNDRYGHRNGDLLLLEVGKLLRGQLRKSDICLRYGGDEFLALLPGVDKRTARQTIRRIQALFDEKPLMNIDGNDVLVGISMGVSTFPADGLDPDMLIAIADRDMYGDKLERTEEEERSPQIVPFERRKE
jgi:diguanylate cyclase (GGDEF)-like protein/putative nucleotidyltransferase with HDIG domain